jgi:hypothetical protein
MSATETIKETNMTMITDADDMTMPAHECVICALSTPTSKGYQQIAWDAHRDGFPSRPVYACDECAKASPIGG